MRTRSRRGLVALTLIGVAMLLVAACGGNGDKYSRQELEEQQQELREMLNAHEIPFASSINSRDNVVELFGTDVARLQELLDAGVIELPSSVMLIVTDPGGFPNPADHPGDFPLSTRPALSQPLEELDAIVAGTLEVNLEANCIVLELEGRRYPVVWPARTTAVAEPFTIYLEDGSSVRPGDFVSGGGGYGHGTDSAIPVQTSCSDTGEIAVFNHYSEIEVTPRSRG